MTGPGPVELILEAPGWDEALPELGEIADQMAALALAEAGLAPERYEIALLACDDARITALNGEFRERDAPTNVLSWPAFSLLPERPGSPPPAPPDPGPGTAQPLGDIAIALETVVGEAKDAGLPLKHHVAHLILHGCLHLLGYDHASDADADVMERVERRLLAELEIADPYERGEVAPRRC